MNAPKTIHKTGKLTGLFLRACGARLHERLAARFLLPLQAGTTAPQSAVERPQSLSPVGRRSRPGVAWLRTLSVLPAGAGRVLRPALPGLLALLVVAGLSAGAEAQTASISPMEIYEGETLEFTFSLPSGHGYNAGPSYGHVEPATGTATEGSSNDWYLADSGGNRISRLDHNSHPAVTDGGFQKITFRLHARTDSATEGDETISLFADDYSGENETVTITLKDGPRPTTSTDGVTLSQSALTLTELGSSSDVEKTYTVVLDTDPGADVTFTATVPAANSSEVEIKTGSAAFGSSATLTFTHGNTGNWSSAQTVTVRALNDANATNTTSFNLTHSLTVASGPYASITPDPVAVSVTDAGHGVVVSKMDVSATVGGATGTYTIQLKSQPGGSVVVTPTSSATARATVSGALTFTNSNWSTPQTVTVTGAGAGSATISHRVTTGTTDYPTSTTIASVTATVAAVPELTFASATYSVTEGDHPNTVTLTVTVNASVAPTSDLTVNLSSAAVTATVNDDYTAPASTFTFTGGNTTETIDVVIGFDDFYEADETFTLTLTDGTGYTVGTPATTTVTIIDEDNVGLRLDAATATVGEGDGTYTVTVSIIGNSETPIDGTLTMADGTATGGSGGTGAGVDYNNDTLTPVRLPAHDTSVTRTIRINDDSIFEGPETFTVTLSIVAGQPRVATSTSRTTVTITDNDTAPPTVTMSASDGDSDGNAVEGATDSTGYRTITLTLGRALTGAETMTVPLTVVGATVTDDYTFGLEPGTQTGVALTTSGGTYTAQNPAVVFSSGGQTATLRLTPVDNNDRTQPYVVVDVGTPISNRGTVSAPTGGPIGIVLVDDETGDIEVPSSWGLAPSGLSGGDDFRLLFRTSTGRDATSSDIAVYDAFVRSVLAGDGHSNIKPYAGFFKVFGSTLDAQNTGAGGTSARVHNGLASVHTGHHDGNSDVWTDGSTRATVGNAAGVPTYWLNGAILANNYADLCDVAWSTGNGVTTGWDTDDPRSEDGTPNIPSGSISDYGPYSTWTGTGNACEAYNHPLGFTTVSRSSADSGGGQSLLHQGSATNTGIHPFYGYSPVFKIEDDTPSEVTVAADWALIPSGISAGEKFRLLFVTSTQRDASATDIATYNTFVQNRAAAGHTAIRSHSAEFRVVASTSSVDARDNSATTGTGVPIYWLGGSNSNKVADNYADFYDGNWDSYVNTNENGADTGNGSGAGNATVWTGSNNNGTRHSSNPLGATNVQYGQLFLGSTNAPFNRGSIGNSNSRHLYGLSPVFTVAAAPPVGVPEISVELPTSEGESRSDAGEKKVAESEGGVGIGFPLSANQSLPSALTVCVRVTESGGDRVASGNEGIKTVSLTSSGMTNGSGTHTLTWTNTAADDQDSSVTVEVLAPNTASCSATNGSYTVSSSEGSDKLLIQDDEDTTVELTSTDVTMTEGDASDTATLTVELSRQLYAGETIGVPIALASTTGARLPGSVDGGSTANHDFTVAAAAGSGHSGVTLAADAPAATPRLVFTGHDSNTVQTATVTLTPVANRDDPDATDETITATLTSPGLVDTTVSGGVTAHASNNAATLTLEDDEAVPAGTPGITLSPAGSLRLLETGTTSYTVVLDAAPTHDVTVTVTKSQAGLTGTGRTPDQNAADPSSNQLTFTTTNWSQPQTVTVTGADESGSHRNRTMRLIHSAGSTDSRYTGFNTNIRVDVDDAPEVEAWPDYDRANGSVPFLRRPNTVVSSNGLTPHRNMYPGYELTYVLRLSNRPEPGGTVTVTATVESGKENLIGLSLTGPSDPLDGPAYQNWATNLPGTLEVTFHDGSPGAGTGCSNWHGGSEFEYHDDNGRFHTVTGGRRSETWDNSADTPWECWRKVWVVRKDASRNIANTCADITHTATGGGVRQVAVDTVRVHIFNADFTQPRDCPTLTDNTLSPQGSPAQAAPAPTEAVANVQLTAVDDASASVSWDAVDHATSYDVSWSAESSDSLSASAGAESVTGTTATIQHDALVPMTLTVTVTPEYVDKNGDTQQLESLAATATLEVGPQPLGGGGTNGGGDGGGVGAGEGDAQASAIAACVSADLMQHVEARIEIAITDRWVRIRNALIGQPNAITLTEVKEIYENRKANGWDTNRLEEVIVAMECIESAMQQSPVPDATPDATPDPVPDPDPDPTPTPDPDPEPEPVACVSPQLRADAEAYSKETWRESADHVERWLRVLQTFSGTANDATVMTPTEAEEYVNRGWERWVPVLEALKCMEQQALDSS